LGTNENQIGVECSDQLHPVLFAELRRILRKSGRKWGQKKNDGYEKNQARAHRNTIPIIVLDGKADISGCASSEQKKGASWDAPGLKSSLISP
jgi:hypothetical protein